MKKALFVPILALLIFGLLNYPVVVHAENVFDGEGSIESPYMIFDPDDLVTLSDLVNTGTENYTNATYLLMEDIDLTLLENYIPIGSNEAYPFNGRFDGNEKNINGLRITYKNSSSITKYFGLFGYNTGIIENIKGINGEINITGYGTIYTGSVAGMNTGSMSNITTDVDIEVVSYAGGLVGNNSGKINNIVNYGNVYGTGNSWGVGGIAGVNRGEISRSANHGYVRGLNVGGITGINFSSYYNDSIITESYNAGSIRGKQSGGITGTTGGIVSYVYNHGPVYGNTSAGGISGVIDENGNVDSSYNIGLITGKSTGGIIGSSAGIVRNSYFLDNIDIGIADGTGSAKQVSLDNIADSDVFSDFDFNTTWVIDSRHPFIQLRNTDHMDVEENNTDYVGGKGTLWSPFLISGKEELHRINLNPSSYFKLISDINLTGDESALKETDWTPLEPFYGSFDGGDYSISNLVIKSPEVQEFGDIFSLGLFTLNYGEISNVKLDGTITVHEETGSTFTVGMLTAVNNGILTEIETMGTITGRAGNIGGIVGANSGEIYDVLNRTHIESDKYSYSSGGIASQNNSIIKRAINIGAVQGGKNAGGIVGLNYGIIDFTSNHAIVNVYDGHSGGIAASIGSGTIKNSFNTGYINQISYSSIIGGIVGNGSSGTLNNVYSIGEVAGDTVGAVAGIAAADTKSGYYLDTVNESGVGSGEDHMVALSHYDMTKIESYEGFDTVSVWEMDENGKYPYIKLKGVPLIFATISFDSNGGTPYDQIELLAGSVLNSEMYLPIKEGYDFEGWYSDQELQTRFDMSTGSINTTVTLYAKWTPLHAISRIYGDNRYRTAVAISNASYAQAGTVILVQANNFPDALAAGPLAFMMDAPILLTSTASLSSSVKEEILRLETKKVIIMGGFSAVSSNVEQSLKAEGYTVERLEGNNRYSTAVGTAKYMEEKLGARKTVVMASGNHFADALAAGSYAAKEGYPILLTDGNRLTKTTMDHITGSGVENIILVGGTSVISEALESQLKAMGIIITRKRGKNRFDTSLEIARSYFGNSETAVVANGMEFADALAAAPYAAKMNAPIILVNQTRINLPIKEYLPTSRINRIVVVGGDAAVNEAVRNELRKLIE